MTPGGGFTDGTLVAGQTFTDTTYNIGINIISATASALTVQVTANGATATPTSTSLSSSANPSTAGNSVTFTASVTGTAPTGSVNFTDNGSSISGCSAIALGGSGNTRTAACSTSSLSVGTHNIVASYVGDTGNAGSTSPTVSQSVTSGQTNTTTGLSSSANPSLVGASVTFTATVSGAAPTGSVTFTNGGVAIGGCSGVALGGSGNIRTAACSTSALAAGTRSIVAAYSGDASNVGSNSPTLFQSVGVGGSSTGLSSSLNPSTVGGNVTFTATVTGTAPTGSVNFTDGGASIAGCSAATLTGSGNTRSASCSTSGLAVGTHNVVATYSGDAGNSGSGSSTVAQVVKAGTTNTTTAVTSSANPSSAGASVTFTASVSGAAPTGSVSFASDGSTISGCAAVALSGSGNTRTAACSTSTLAAGTRSINASYAGDANNIGSTSPTLFQSVSAGGSTTNLASSPNPSLVGNTVTFTATVSGSAPTGSLNFTDGGASISGCSGVALVGSGNTRTASCFTSSLAAGTHSIVASYGGDAGNTASSSSGLTQRVASNTTTSLASSPNPSAVGVNVTFTVSVTGAAPTGSINFASDGSSIAGCAAVTLAGSGNTRTASCATSTLAAGTRSINAVYTGDANNVGSTSPTLFQSVGAGGSATILASSLNPSPAGSSVTFTATVTGISPSGNVNFADGGTSIGSCSSVPLSSFGNSGTATCTTSGLIAGTHNIVATYGGDGNNAGSTSSTVAQTVNLAANIASPVGGNVSGVVAILVNASDNAGVTRVDLLVNGQVIGSASAAPYQFSWNTAGVANGAVQLMAIAYGPAGTSAQSAIVTVNVANVVTPPPPGNPPTAPNTGSAVEYYHPTLDHYFITASPSDIALLDSGQFSGWARTGYSFKVFTQPTGAANPVCRFYIPPSLGDSHFYSASPEECQVATVKFPLFIEESTDVFFVNLPDTTTGACPANMIPIYRAWNNRRDSNHRYMTDRTLRDQMVARGYIAEGYGPDIVIMCSPM